MKHLPHPLRPERWKKCIHEIQKLLPTDPVTVIDEFIRCLLTYASRHTSGEKERMKEKEMFWLQARTFFWGGGSGGGVGVVVGA